MELATQKAERLHMVFDPTALPKIPPAASRCCGRDAYAAAGCRGSRGTAGTGSARRVRGRRGGRGRGGARGCPRPRAGPGPLARRRGAGSPAGVQPSIWRFLWRIRTPLSTKRYTRMDPTRAHKWTKAHTQTEAKLYTFIRPLKSVDWPVCFFVFSGLHCWRHLVGCFSGWNDHRTKNTLYNTENVVDNEDLRTLHEHRFGPVENTT